MKNEKMDGKYSKTSFEEKRDKIIKLSTDAFTKPIYFKGFKQIIFKKNDLHEL